jgi:hypothetical protein
VKTIYTAIFGNYDDLKEPWVVTPGWRYVCFTDQNLKSDVWEIMKVPVMECGPAKTARYYKIMYHQHIQDEFSIWIDATFIVNVDLDQWWRKFKAPFTTIAHPFDDCVYREGSACLRAGKGDPTHINDQMTFFKRIGLPKKNGLIASGILMRQRDSKVREFCIQWWRTVLNHSSRDQIAFAYVDFIKPGVHHSIQWNYTREKEFLHIPHLSKRGARERRWQEIEEHHGKLQSK